MFNQSASAVLSTLAAITTTSMAWLGSQTPALAGNEIFNQDLAKIESYFGRYFTRLTVRDDGTTTQRIYTFNPAGLRRAMPNLPSGTKFAIEFVNGRAQTIRLAVPDSGGAVNTAFYNQATASTFFKYVLGWNPPTWFQLDYSLFGAYQEEYSEYCLGDGVATAWKTVVLNAGGVFVESPRLYYKTECEPPYQK